MIFVYMLAPIIYKDFFPDNPVVIHDGPNKLRLFIDGMQKEDVKSKFVSVSEEWKE